MGPAGNGAFELGEDSPANAALKKASIRTIVHGFRSTLPLGSDIDLHLIVGVVEITAWVPDGGFGLHPSLTVGGAGEDCVVPGFGGLPVVAPGAPRVFRLVSAGPCFGPGGARVG